MIPHIMKLQVEASENQCYIEHKQNKRGKWGRQQARKRTSLSDLCFQMHRQQLDLNMSNLHGCGFIATRIIMECISIVINTWRNTALEVHNNLRSNYTSYIRRFFHARCLQPSFKLFC
jgi:hypothetical protein